MLLVIALTLLKKSKKCDMSSAPKEDPQQDLDETSQENENNYEMQKEDEEEK